MVTAFAVAMFIIAGICGLFEGGMKYAVSIVASLIVVPPVTRYFMAGDTSRFYDMFFVISCIPIMAWAASRFQKIDDSIEDEFRQNKCQNSADLEAK